MIFNMIGGGSSSGGLNLEVVGGTTQPSAPAENTIWVNTDTAIGNTYLSAEEPASPASGDVWVCTDGAMLCTLTVAEDPTVTLNICKLYQRQSGAWVLTGGGVMSGRIWYDLTANVYGIKRLLTATSPAWARTDLSENFTATASVGSVAGYSDFDNCMPWKGMVRETLSTGDVMVKIPAFWYRRYRDASYEYIQIADAPKTGFSLHPAFCHSDAEKDCIYVGAYRTSDGLSKSGATATSSNVDETRNAAVAKGTGWNLFDISTLSAIQMLYLVEYANNNSQDTIGVGATYYSSEIMTKSELDTTGGTDSVANLTGKIVLASSGYNYYVVYRGIENLWGGSETYVDGINIYKANKSLTAMTYYVSNDPEAYARGTSDNYTLLSYNCPNYNKFIKSMGLDENLPWVMLADDVYGSATTGFCDYFRNAGSSSAATAGVGFRSYFGGGYSTDTSLGTWQGLFYEYNYYPGNSSVITATTRLIYIPQ